MLKSRKDLKYKENLQGVGFNSPLSGSVVIGSK
jgi:hypothetical protein